MVKLVRWISVLCFVSAMVMGFGVAVAQDDAPPSPQWLYASGVFSIDDEEVQLDLKMRVFLENDWVSGLWEVTFEDAPPRLQQWGARIEDEVFAFRRDYFPMQEELAINISGEIVSETEVTGTFSFNDNEIEFVAVPLEEEEPPETDVETGTLMGVVFSSSWAIPIPDANITLDLSDDGTDGGRTVTDEYGRFEFTEVPIGTHSVTIDMFSRESAQRYCPNSMGITFFMPDAYPGISDVGFAITGTTNDGRFLYGIGAPIMIIEYGGEVAVSYINVDCQ